MKRNEHNILRLHRGLLFVLLLAVIMTIPGCSKAKNGKKQQQQKVNKVEIKKDPDFILDENRSFVVIYEEDFTEDYYSKDELEAMVDRELKEFNENYAVTPSQGVVKTDCTVEKGKAKLSLKFSSYADYISYEQNYVSSTRNARMFIGSYSELVAAGFHVPQRLTAADGVTAVTSDGLAADEQINVIFTNQKFNMNLPGEVAAVNESVKVDSASGVVYTSDKRENYIFFKKEAAQPESNAQ